MIEVVINPCVYLWAKVTCFICPLYPNTGYFSANHQPEYLGTALKVLSFFIYCQDLNLNLKPIWLLMLSIVVLCVVAILYLLCNSVIAFHLLQYIMQSS